MNQWKQILLPLVFWITSSLMDCLVLPPVSAQMSGGADFSLTEIIHIVPPSHFLWLISYGSSGIERVIRSNIHQ